MTTQVSGSEAYSGREHLLTQPLGFRTSLELH